MRILISVIVLMLATRSVAQIAFYKQFSNSGYDYGQGVVQLEDSSYLITGSSSSFEEYQSQAFMLKVDSMGNYLWSTHYGGSESEWGRRILYKQGFGMFVCGFTNSTGAGAYDYYLVKTDESGLPEWEKTYGGSGWEKVHDAVMTIDTGVVMVGENNSNLTNNLDAYIVRTDKNGDTLWTKKLGGNGNDWATSVELYQDTILVVAGMLYVESQSEQRGFITKIHSLTGDIIHLDTIGVSGNYSINDFIIVNDELEAVGAFWVTPDDLDMTYFRYDLITNTLLSAYPEVEPTDDRRGLVLTTYGVPSERYVGYNIISGDTFPVGEDLHVGHFTDTYVWLNHAAKVAHDGQDEPGQFIPTSDGGAILVGFTTSNGMGGGNVFLCKIGPGETYPLVEGVTDVFNMVNLPADEVLEGYRIYPNPASNYLKIETPSNDHVTLCMYNELGVLLVENENFGQEVLDLSDYANGTYFIRIRNAQGESGNYKLVILK